MNLVTQFVLLSVELSTEQKQQKKTSQQTSNKQGPCPQPRRLPAWDHRDMLRSAGPSSRSWPPDPSLLHPGLGLGNVEPHSSS